MNDYQQFLNLKTAAQVALDKHRKEVFYSCPETCWCWDLEMAIMKTEETIKVTSVNSKEG